MAHGAGQLRKQSSGRQMKHEEALPPGHVASLPWRGQDKIVIPRSEFTRTLSQLNLGLKLWASCSFLGRI